MSSILGFAQTLGLGALNMRGCFGGMLDLFNLLQRCNVPMADLPIVEDLYRLLEQEIFMDKELRPTRNFDSILARFCGGSLGKHEGKGLRIQHPKGSTIRAQV
jgi:hypothetical protein